MPSVGVFYVDIGYGWNIFRICGYEAVNKVMTTHSAKGEIVLGTGFLPGGSKGVYQIGYNG